MKERNTLSWAELKTRAAASQTQLVLAEPEEEAEEEEDGVGGRAMYAGEEEEEEEDCVSWRAAVWTDSRSQRILGCEEGRLEETESKRR